MIDLAAICRELIDAKGSIDEPQRLDRFLDASWQYRMEQSPEFATWVGYPGQNSRWTDMSGSAIEARKAVLKERKSVLDSIDASTLNDSERLNYDLVVRAVSTSIEGIAFPQELMGLSARGGPHTNVAGTISMMPAETPDARGDILARIEGIAGVIDQSIELLRRGIDESIVMPRVIVEGVEESIDAQMVDDPKDSPYLRPLVGHPELEQAALIFESQLVPALKRLREFATDTYLPACRASIALSDLPSGDEWYDWQIRYHTTTSLTAEEIHDIGRAEVARIRAQMEEVIRKVNFDGSFQEFVDFLRTDPQFFFESADDLIATYRNIAKRADPELARLFGTLPRLPYGVSPTPDYLEKTSTTAFYRPGSPVAGRAGIYFANTYDLRARPKWEMEALTLHEAVPGHHLQIALAQELEGIPEFRKHELLNGYVEGWALYAESLGEEIGFYSDPYSKFGQLTYEMWRAIRLVVDTGIHRMGWSRAQAIEVFKSNTSKTDHDIQVEVDRYIGWPGQALAYKIGELKFKELRAYAETTLGERFNIREFHDAVLLDGALPLDVLEQRVRDWTQKD